MCHSIRGFLALAVAVALLGGLALRAPGGRAPRKEIVREDWYLRESLRAVRDWEQILAGWEKTTARQRRTPVLAVPRDGAWVTWPNPIPPRLRIGPTCGQTLRVRMADGKVEVLRAHPGGKTAVQRIAPGAVVVGCKHPAGGGKDRWYHRYRRRFDDLCVFRPVAAPFAMEPAATDLKSLRGTPAETQRVAWPAPPKPQPFADPSQKPSGDWVWLSDLRWQAAGSD